MKNWKHCTVVAIVAIVAPVFAVLSLTSCDNGTTPTGSTNQTPIAADFNISGTGTFTYDGNPKAVTVTAKEGKTGGTITVKYHGNAAAPSAAGTYTVTFDVAAATGWNAASGLSAGTLTINAISSYTVTFNADNGTANTTQTVTEGNTATKPADPSKTYTPIGLYAGTPPTACTFVEWQKPDGSAWNFTADTVTADITLTAQWTVPTLIDLADKTGNNIVEKAVSYVNANGGSEYTLVLGESVSNVAPQTLDQDDTTLTITSDGNIERKISLGENGSLFTIGGFYTGTNPDIEYHYRSMKLIIDGHITLVGKTDNNTSLVYVRYGGSLELKGYVKLTENKNVELSGGGGVSVDKSILIMSGNAEISNNAHTGGPPFRNGGGVHLSQSTFTMNDSAAIKENIASNNGGGVAIGDNGGSTFTMNGGTISNNTATYNGGGVFINLGTSIFAVASEQVKAGIHSNTANNLPQVYLGPAYAEFPKPTFTVGGEPADSF